MELFVLEIHISLRSLILFGMRRLGVPRDECPGAVVGVEVVTLEAFVIMSEREPKWRKGYLRR